MPKGAGVSLPPLRDRIPAHMTERRGEKLIGIQLGRAVAAILVVLYHGGRMLPQYVGPIDVAKYFTFGNAGVDFFFALSGFIIFYVHQQDINSPARLGHYLFRRTTRVYPIYWAVTLLAIGLLVAKRDWATLSPAHVIASLLLIPEARQWPIVGVAWTLCHEMMFYAVFAIFIYSRIMGICAVALWTAVVGFGLFVPHSGLLNFIESPYHIEFAFGALAAYLARAKPVRIAPALAGMGILAFLIVGLKFNHLLGENQFTGRLLYGLSSTFIIYGLAVWESGGKLRYPGWAAYLGAASYSIYLIHTFLLGWAGRLAANIVAPGSAPDLLYLICAIAAVMGGCALYQFVERPLQAMTRRKPSSLPLPGIARP